MKGNMSGKKQRKNNGSARKPRQLTRDRENQYKLRIAELEQKRLILATLLTLANNEVNRIKNIYYQAINAHFKSKDL
ncbi:hypothetical protein GJ496_007778 [Pomphorhynchus laevis]|nr:hypothetical protein GJ496_007778 [Pomphorhynchus laevis]